MRRDVGGGGVDGRTLFGLSINVMPFDYGFSFAGHRATAHNLSLGPVEDLNDLRLRPRRWRTASDRLRCQPGASQRCRSRWLSATVSAAADRDGGCRSPGRRPRYSGAGRARHHPAALERHRAADRPGDRARAVCGAGRAHAGCRGGDLRGPHAELRGARRATPTGWRIICKASASGRRRWWRCASSARRKC